MKNLFSKIFFFILIFFVIDTYAQNCDLPESLSENWRFDTQEDIDNFKIEYPECTLIKGDVLLRGSSITSLAGLSNIIRIEGELLILSFGSLPDTEKLNLNYVGGLKVQQTGLENLNMLSRLDSVNMNIDILSNSSLTNLTTFYELTYVGGNIMIDENIFLEVIGGFNKLLTVRTIGITDNRRLSDIVGFEELLFADGIGILTNASLLRIEGFNKLEVLDGVSIANCMNLQYVSGFNNLIEIREGLLVDANEDLILFDAFNNLKTVVGVVRITECEKITTLNFLENLTFVGESFTVSDTDISNIQGLRNLTTVNYLSISDNQNLQNIDGLENLKYANSIVIKDNNQLRNISGLSSLDFSSLEQVELLNNKLLSICHFPSSICDHLDICTILGNDVGCQSVEEVMTNCLTSYENIVSYPIFYDQNENGILDNEEPFLTDICINIEQLDILACGNSTNGGLTYLENGEYTFSFDSLVNKFWRLTTDSISFTINLEGDLNNNTLYFGFVPVDIISDVTSFIYSQPLRCNELRKIRLITKNRGTTITSGTIWVEIDFNVSVHEFITPPDTLGSLGQFGWDISNLLPGNNYFNEIQILVPGPPGFPVGDELSFASWLNYFDQNGEHQADTFIYSQIVECSYDPNDKLVHPSNSLDYSLFDEDLIYTVRFQNTGNAEAYDIVIRDTLDQNIDPSSFSFIGSSHDRVLTTTLKESKYLTFDFSNIYLPDSTTNFEGSQGFVMYKVRSRAGLSEETIIENSASIYFDFNPPILTNTTENRMVTSFDSDQDDVLIWDDCDDFDSTIYPGANETLGNGIDEDCDGEDSTVSTLSILEEQIHLFPNPTSGNLEVTIPSLKEVTLEVKSVLGKTIISRYSVSDSYNYDLSEYESGVYFFIFETTNGNIVKRVVKN